MEFDKLLNRQFMYARYLRNFMQNFEKIGKDKHTASTIESRQKLLEQYWQTFQSNNLELYDIADDTAIKTEEYFVNDEYSEVELCYTQHFAALAELQLKLRATQPSNHVDQINVAHHNHTADIPLPRIQLPKFNGSSLEWESFRDLFTALVHSKRELSNVQKLHYLKCSLTGEAEQLLRNIQSSDANYAGAWDMLIKRYDNSRLLITAHLNRLFSIQKMSHESFTGLKQLLDGTMEIVRALKNLGRPVDYWDDILIFITAQKLDNNSRKEWETTIGAHTDMPTFEEMEDFMTSRVNILEAMNNNSSTSKIQSTKTIRSVQSLHVDVNKCPFCQRSNHPLWACLNFKRQSISKRRDFAQSSNVCFNCLKLGHRQSDCGSKSYCRHCNESHHSLLHLKSTPIDSHSSSSSQHGPHQSTSNNTSSSNINKSSSYSQNSRFHTPPAAASTFLSSSTPHSNTNISVNTTTCSEPYVTTNCENQSSSFVAQPVQAAPVLLATANVAAINHDGQSITLRALIDPGSEVTLITEFAVQRLNLRRSSSSLVINGVGAAQAGKTKGKVSFTMKSYNNEEFSIQVNAFIIPKITKLLPSQKIVISDWTFITGLPLADPSFSIPAQVDILIGADLYMYMLCDGIRRGPSGTPIAIETKLGWILTGPTKICNNHESDVQCYHLSIADTKTNLNNQLRRFWELENIDTTTIPLSKEDKHCEQHFITTHKRAPDGRYIVRLPFRPTCSIADLGVSRHIAVHRMRSLNKRLSANAELHSQYTNFLVEYAHLNHMVEDVPQIKSSYYLPHHGIIKSSSSSTKLRVVFNASQPTSSGNSLNDLICIGPKLQTDLHDLIVRWRTHFVVFTADIEKMYRQILVNDEDTQLQRIVWSSGPGLAMQDYRLRTVTYGTACAPYLALRTLKQLVIDDGPKYPLGSKVLQSDFYVDDVLSGAEDETQALAIQNELRKLVQEGGFTLKKWSSNRKSLLEAVPENFRECNAPLSLNPDDCVKTLGLFWYPLNDTFQYKVNVPEHTKPTTKRSMLSDVAKLYDPIGLVAPVIVTAKVMIQELWLSGTGWDDPLDANITSKWQSFVQHLKSLEQVSIDRWVGALGSQHRYQLHGFSDASTKAYAAAVYLRVENASGDVQCSFICSKTKVAPIKIISVARLELCGAELLAQLLVKVKNALQFNIDSIYAWTDSTIVLHWLQKEPNAWQTFIGNRVSHIQQRVPAEHWHHVSTTDNPADHATRGLTPSELNLCKLWWSGPEWLASPSENWPAPTVQTIDETQLERKSKGSVVSCTTSAGESLLAKFSSLAMLLKVTAWCKRFIANSKIPKEKRDLKMFVSSSEMKQSTKIWCQLEQSCFEPELNALQSGGPVSNVSRLAALNPFVDDDGIIRVGGRLVHANLSYDEKHPIIVPNESRLAESIIDHAHRDLKHAGAQATLSYTRQRFWILSGRDLVRRHIHRCVTCTKYRARCRYQIMGNLPSVRVQQSRPFHHVGLDYAGPVMYRPCSGRGLRRYKAYIALFVCFVTKAVIIEVVGDSSAETCIAALRRFVARVGVPSDIYSDCGTNFVGSDNQLQSDVIKYTREQRIKIEQYAATKGVTWHFNPPSSPHFGGIWEAGVKSAKHLLKKTVGDSALTLEELRTLLMEIEACLNSRPLYAMSSDASDLNALTPAHLMGREPLGALPEPSYLNTKSSLLSRWQLIQQKMQSFWHQWQRDYLHQLTQRPKWKRPQQSIQVGDLVVVKGDSLTSTRWPLARVIEVHPGDDGHVRVATIKTATSILKRPIVKLCLLPIESPVNKE